MAAPDFQLAGFQEPLIIDFLSLSLALRLDIRLIRLQQQQLIYICAERTRERELSGCCGHQRAKIISFKHDKLLVSDHDLLL